MLLDREVRTMISDNIAFYLLKNGYIQENELPIYKYGLSAFCNSVFQLGIIMVLGILTGTVLETIAFLIVFVFTRRFLGGYHANTKGKCLMLDVLVWAFATNTFFISIYSNVVCLGMIVFVFSLSVTCRYAPIENVHKQITLIQKKKNKKKGLVMICVFSMGAIVMCNVSIKMAYTIFMTLLCVTIFMLTGRRANVKGEIK